MVCLFFLYEQAAELIANIFDIDPKTQYDFFSCKMVQVIRGVDKMKSITVQAKTENIEKVTEFVNEILEEVSCPIKVQMQIDIAIDEIFGNIVHYAYGMDEENAIVRVEVEQKMEMIVLTFIDRGIPYNPTHSKEPDITLPIEERKAGGLGIHIVKKTMDEITYEYVNGSNILKIKKTMTMGRAIEK